MIGGIRISNLDHLKHTSATTATLCRVNLRLRGLLSFQALGSNPAGPVKDYKEYQGIALKPELLDSDR